MIKSWYISGDANKTQTVILLGDNIFCNAKYRIEDMRMKSKRSLLQIKTMRYKRDVRVFRRHIKNNEINLFFQIRCQEQL